MILSFSGLDGAGKSTLISTVRNFLKDNKKPFITLTMYDHVGIYALIRQIRDRMVGRPANQPKVEPGMILSDENTGTLRAKFVKLIRSRTVKKGVLIIDLVLFQFYRLYIEVFLRKILILDRYFYDSLVDLADGTHWIFIDWIFSTVPIPIVPCFIDVNARSAFSRKGEYTVEYLDFRYTVYKRLFGKLKKPFFLKNENLEEAKVALVEEIGRLIGK